MEYEQLSHEGKIDMINDRILNLEKHIFHNEMLLAENNSIELFDAEGLESLGLQIATYEEQVSALKDLKNTLTN